MHSTVNKTIMFLIVPPFLLCLFSSCKNDNTCITKINGNGTYVKNEIMHDAFNFLKIEGSFTIHLDMSKTPKTIINAEKNIIDQIEMQTSNGVLTIKPKRNTCISHSNVDIYLNATLLSSIQIFGSTKVDGIIKSKKLNIITNGSATISLQGNCDSIEATSNGSSIFNLYGLVCDSSKFTLNGSSIVYTHTLETLFANINGAGFIYYKGHPNITQKTNGSGKLIGTN